MPAHGLATGPRTPSTSVRRHERRERVGAPRSPLPAGAAARAWI